MPKENFTVLVRKSKSDCLIILYFNAIMCHLILNWIVINVGIFTSEYEKFVHPTSNSEKNCLSALLA